MVEAVGDGSHVPAYFCFLAVRIGASHKKSTPVQVRGTPSKLSNILQEYPSCAALLRCLLTLQCGRSDVTMEEQVDRLVKKTWREQLTQRLLDETES